MEINKLDHPSVLLIQITGKFDLEQAEYFQEQYKLLTQSSPGVVCLDMQKVQFIDSSGLGALIKALNSTRGFGGELILVGLNAVILNVFRLAKLDNFFKLLSEAEFQRKYPAND
ncbi:MAG: STAS domain-containing protein [Leptospiraceae bacterium]|nr:STAS domain-containing protein [Leptospiraceae bacterium]